MLLMDLERGNSRSLGVHEEMRFNVSCKYVDRCTVTLFTQILRNCGTTKTPVYAEPVYSLQ